MNRTSSCRGVAAVGLAAALALTGCGDDDTAALDAGSAPTDRVDPLDSDDVTDATDPDATGL